MKRILLYASTIALMLSSCAKEMAESFAPAQEVEGNTTIIVSYDTGDDVTRTHLGPHNGKNKPYIWDEGDVIGVYATEIGNMTNAPFKFLKSEGDDVAEFKGTLNYFEEGGSYIVYYPHTNVNFRQGKINQVEGVVGKEQILLNIPALQLFNFETKGQSGERSGSFAQSTAPAIGIGHVEDDKLVVTLKGAASYMLFPIKGTGYIKKLELSIDGEEHLNGYNQVVANIEDPDFGFKAPTANGTDKITLECGAVELFPHEATNFWFVVPNLKLQGAKITLTINGNEKLTLVREGYSNGDGFEPNKNYRIYDRQGDENKDWYIEIPADETDPTAYIIDSEDKFLQYAYAATVASMPEGVSIPAEMLNGGALKTAKIVVSELNFSEKNFTFEAIGSEFRKTVANLYNATKSIPTIGGAMAYEIVGAVAAAQADAEAETPAVAAPATIKNLNVVGDGLFHDGFITGGNLMNTVSNINLSHITVDGKCVLTDRMYTDGLITLKDISVDDCTATNGALIGRAFTSNIVEFGGNHAETLKYADELNIVGDVWLGDGENEINVSYNTVIVNRYGTPNHGAIVTVKDKKAVQDFMNAYNVSSQNKSDWYSIKDATGTFYYTGTPATATTLRDNDEFTTAEEFAYYIKNGGNYALTHSIDMMGEEVEATATNANVTVAEGKNVTISNVVVKSAYLLAKTGTATGVNVEADYSKAKAVDSYVGGLFLYAAAADAAKTTGSVKATAAPADATFGSFYGYINMPLNGNAAELTLAGDFTENVAEGAYAPYGSIICTAAVELAENGYTNITFTGTNVDLNAIKAHIKWIWTEEYPIPAGYHLVLLHNGKNEIVPFVFEINNDDTLAKAIEDAVNATDNKTVEIPAGVFKAPNLTGAAGVAIVGEVDEKGNPTTVFDGAFANPEGVEIKNVKFTYENAPEYKDKGYSRGVVDGALKGTYTNCVFEGASALYQCTVSEDLTFNGCTFTANENPNSWALQFNSGAGKATFNDCKINGWFGLGAITGGYKFKGCEFTFGGNRCGGHLYCDTVFDDCKFIGFPNENTPNKKKFQWISLNNDKDAEGFTTTFKACSFDGVVVSTKGGLLDAVVYYNVNPNNKLSFDGVTTIAAPVVEYDASKY